MSHTKPDADWEYRLSKDMHIEDPYPQKRLDDVEDAGEAYIRSEDSEHALFDHEITFIYRELDSGREGTAYYNDDRYGRKPWGSDYEED